MEFKAKTEQGTEMVTEAVTASVPFGWAVGDEVYGRSSKLRATCEDAGKGYVFAVPVNFTVTTPAGRAATVAALARLVPARCWQTRSCGRGCKGHRDYQQALAATRSPRHWLLIRRKISDPTDLAFFYCHAPGPVSLATLTKVAGKRWPVEECFLLQGSPGRRTKLRRAPDGELLQQTSVGVVLLVAAALSFAVSGQGRWCNTCGVTTRC